MLEALIVGRQQQRKEIVAMQAAKQSRNQVVAPSSKATAQAVEVASRATWPASLLTEAKGLPLCLLFPEKSFLDLFGNRVTDLERQKKYLELAKNGFDAHWLLSMFPPGSTFDVGRVCTQGQLNRLSGEAIKKGLLECKLLDESLTLIRKAASPFAALIRNRGPRFRRWAKSK